MLSWRGLLRRNRRIPSAANLFGLGGERPCDTYKKITEAYSKDVRRKIPDAEGSRAIRMEALEFWANEYYRVDSPADLDIGRQDWLPCGSGHIRRTHHNADMVHA
jgi:hypothetical protein